MNDTEDQNWTPCEAPKTGDVLRWNEPLWAAPNKPRGKRDKIGEQEVIATLTTARNDLLQLTVIAARKLGMRGVGTDIDDDYINYAKRRLQTFQPDLWESSGS